MPSRVDAVLLVASRSGVHSRARVPGDRRAQVRRNILPKLNAVKCCSNARLRFTRRRTAKSTSGR